MIRRAAAFLVALLAGAALWAPAASATSYRYWTYWSGTGTTWTFSSVGPASAVPGDGTVQGWRFAVTQGVRGQGEQPRIAVAEAFDRFCGRREAAPGMKRIAIVFDFGTATDAPPEQVPPASRGTCVVAPNTATGARILSEAAGIRTESGLVCAIGGYPSGECAPAIADRPAKAEGPPPSDDDGERRRPASSATSGKSQSAPPAGPDHDGASPAPEPGPESGGGTATTPKSKVAPSARPGADTPYGGSDRRGSEDVGAGSSAATRPTAPAPAPVFIEADAAATAPPRSWLPLAATVALITAIGGFIWWRRAR